MFFLIGQPWLLESRVQGSRPIFCINRPIHMSHMYRLLHAVLFIRPLAEKTQVRPCPRMCIIIQHYIYDSIYSDRLATIMTEIDMFFFHIHIIRTYNCIDNFICNNFIQGKNLYFNRNKIAFFAKFIYYLHKRDTMI